VPRDLRRLAGIDQPRAVDAATIAAMRPFVAALHLPGVRRGYEGVLGTGGAARAA